jgi:hypothetical protein
MFQSTFLQYVGLTKHYNSLNSLNSLNAFRKNRARPLSIVTASGKERQKHGFTYQTNVIDKYSLIENKSYTAEYDALFQNIPVQIKCSKQGGALEMGDYMRNKNKSTDFILAVGLWEHDKTNSTNNKILSKEYLLYIEHSRFISNIGYYTDIIEYMMYEDFKQISNSRDDDVRWTEFRLKYKELWPDTHKIDIRFKRDHKKQKRIQCAISWSNLNQWLINDFEHIKMPISERYLNKTEVLHNEFLT